MTELDFNDDVRAFYKLFRSYEEHENLLLHHRVTWLITVQSVLVATFGFSIQKHYEIAEKIGEKGELYAAAARATMHTLEVRFGAMLLMLCAIGLVSGAAGFWGVRAAVCAQNTLREHWRKHFFERAEKLHLPHIAGGGHGSAERAGAFLATALPLFFVTLWLIVLGFMYFKWEPLFGG